MADYKPKRFKSNSESPSGGSSASHFGSAKSEGGSRFASSKPAGKNAGASSKPAGGSRFASSKKGSAPASRALKSEGGQLGKHGSSAAGTAGSHAASNASAKKPDHFSAAGSGPRAAAHGSSHAAQVGANRAQERASKLPSLGRHGSSSDAAKTLVKPLGGHSAGNAANTTSPAKTAIAPSSALAGSHAKGASAASPKPVTPSRATSGSYHTGDAKKGKAGLLAKKGAGSGANDAKTGKGSKPELGKNGKPKKGARDWISRILIIVGVGLMLAAAGIFIHAQIGYKQATDTYDDLAKYAKVKDTDGENIPNPDFDSLSAINKDIVGWIYIPGTTINYPVVQGTDNEHYLRTMFEGTWNASGTIFMDMDGTAPGMVDQQTTIYGHHMENGGMFNPIADTVDQSTFDNIKHVYYITKDHVYKLKPLLTHVVDGSYTDARTPNFTEDGTSLTSYLQTMLKDAEAKASDASDRAASAEQVLTLVTCKRDVLQNGRAAMICTIEKTTDRS